jgi:hypothetical protein
LIISSPDSVPLKKDPTWLLPNLDASYEEEEEGEGDMNNNQLEKPRCSNKSNNNNKHSRLPEEVCLS